MSDQSDLSDARGAGRDALRETLQRPTSIAPPPPPGPAVVARRSEAEQPAGTEQTGSDELETSSGQAETEAKSTTTRRRRRQSPQAKAPSDDDLIGQPKGNLRQISVRLPQPIRDLVDEDNVADPDLSLGVIGMDAVRTHLDELLAQAPARDDTNAGHGFAPRRRVVRRSARGPKIPTPMSVTPEEARRLGELREELGMSVNRIIEESLERYYSDRLP